MTKFRKKPVEIEAMQFMGVPNFAVTPDGSVDMEYAARFDKWLMDKASERSYPLIQDGDLYIKTLEGEMAVDARDWIICGVEGELYPCKPSVFEATYVESTGASAPSSAVALEDLKTWRKEWLEANDPQNDTDVVTPFDKYLYTN